LLALLMGSEAAHWQPVLQRRRQQRLQHLHPDLLGVCLLLLARRLASERG
jgi:hypothetical protein